jgi:hypothetical protein
MRKNSDAATFQRKLETKFSFYLSIWEGKKKQYTAASHFQILIKPFNSPRNVALCLCHSHPPLVDDLHNIKTTKKKK